MASNYNHIPRPAAVSVASGKSQVLLRRETIEDLLTFDAGVN
jgi:diaminopimelate decarboxylase